MSEQTWSLRAQHIAVIAMRLRITKRLDEWAALIEATKQFDEEWRGRK